MRETRSRHGARGAPDEAMTIVELMIASFIVMFAFAALAATVIASFNAIRVNENRVVATALANEVLEEMSAMPWRQVGILVGELEEGLEFDGDLVEVATDPETGEDVLQFRDESVAVVGDGAPPQSDTLERDGRSYEVARMVTWFEGGGPSVKRMLVTVSWDDGRRSIRVEGLRAPDPADEVDLKVSFEWLGDSDDSDTADRRMVLGDGCPSDLEHSGTIYAGVRVGEGTASVSLSFRDRHQLRTYVLPTVPEEDEQVLAFAITACTWEFPHGPVSFAATATGVEEETATALAVMHFYQDLAIETVAVRNTDTDEVVDQIHVCSEDGTLRDPLTIEAAVAGLTNAEATDAGALTLQWRMHPGQAIQFHEPDPPLEFGAVSSTPDGGVYQVSLDTGTVFIPLEDRRVDGDVRFVIEATRDVVDADGTSNDAFSASDSYETPAPGIPVSVVACS